LRSGNHAEIDRWRKEQQIERTRIRRPDLYQQWLEENQGADAS
ncbi:MAG: tRNA (guanosine(37)-N1)-methyltransferase TrmD, partial [Phormidesmis sp. CAN_BIN44]|nr:tRNA (guanosine(37)-N1)-methyltransferase TrmD [Phormidesmis sp. CAN_BIN44]